MRYCLLVSILLLFACKVERQLIPAAPIPLSGIVIECDRFVNLYDTTEILKKKTTVALYMDSIGITFTAFLEEEDIRYTLTNRDTTIWKDPCIEIFMDPGADGLNYYELQLNAYPQVWDLKLKSSKPPINAKENMLPWDIGTNFGIAKLDGIPNDNAKKDRSWSVVGTIDWATMDGAPYVGDRMGYNFMRVDYDDKGKPTYWVAKSTGTQNIHEPSTWPIFTF
jgi:hypothetical protein